MASEGATGRMGRTALGFPNPSTGICKFAQHIRSRRALLACGHANQSGTLLLTQRWKPKRDASQGRIRRGDVSRIPRRSLRLRCPMASCACAGDSSTRWAKARGEALVIVYCLPLHASSSPERRKTRSVAAQATRGCERAVCGVRTLARFSERCSGRSSRASLPGGEPATH